MSLTKIASILACLACITCTLRAQSPALGEHTLAANSGRADRITTAPIDTSASGSTILALVARGIGGDFTGSVEWKDKPATRLPAGNIDSAKPRQLGTTHDYSPLWPNSGEALFAWESAKGGNGNTFSVPMTPADEITFAVVEIKNGGAIQDVKWNKTLASPHTSPTVTTTGPATLVAFWLGDSGAKAVTATPGDGFTTIESQLNSDGWVEVVVATKDVPSAGKYGITWTATPEQGAHLWLVAIGQNAKAK